ncbi:MAG: class I SAM-dependent rRNA methyltransferase [Puniceicoccales bacterium]
MSATLKLKPGPSPRVLRGHPWVFAGELTRLLPAEHNGEAVELRDARGRFLGMGLYNGRSQIAWRRYSRDKDAFDEAFLMKALEAAISRRAPDTARRLVWAEADGLPGLVVDQFGKVLVVQALTAGMDNALPLISNCLQSLLAPDEIVFRNDAPSRKLEGLENSVTTLSGERAGAEWLELDGIEFFVDLQSGHKTGFYLDQRVQHQRVAELAKGRRVLDGFCHQGGFALHCAKAGASSVLAVDISEECVKTAQLNAGKNRLTVDFGVMNMFDWFTANRNETFDLIVLDPPSFARSKKSLHGALRGYKELNLRAMRMLSPGGILATYSCSQNVAPAQFMSVLAEAAGDARRDFAVLEETGQPADHPVLLTMPESHYLKGAILQLR